MFYNVFFSISLRMLMDGLLSAALHCLHSARAGSDKRAGRIMELENEMRKWQRYGGVGIIWKNWLRAILSPILIGLFYDGRAGN